MAAAPGKWRTSEDAPGSRGLIGPNAILQLLPVIEARGGPGLLADLLRDAGVAAVPDGTGMIDEREAARLHQALRRRLRQEAPHYATEAGIGTADYILAHRIPDLAKRIMRLSPPPVAARLLAGAITRHAWTFAGSGSFRQVNPYVFEIADNPVIRGERSPCPLCHWHAAVFSRLFETLVSPRMHCRETACGAMGGGVCRFKIERIEAALPAMRAQWPGWPGRPPSR